MKSYLYRNKSFKEGYNLIVNSGNSELKWLEFGIVNLQKKGSVFSAETGNKEAALSLLGGRCNIEIESPKKVVYKRIGERENVFAGKPTMVYLPRGVAYKIVSESPTLEVGVFKAPSELDCPPSLITPNDVAARTVGSWNWSRKVYSAVGDNVKAERLIVGETINPPGNWSSSPPHKHDTHSSVESPYEEVYFFRVKPSQGFGIQRVYTAPGAASPLDEVYVVKNNDTVVIPRGYHPVVAGPGYQLYYLWALAGEERRYAAWSDDPEHEWLKNCEPIINEVLKGSHIGP